MNDLTALIAAAPDHVLAVFAANVDGKWNATTLDAIRTEITRREKVAARAASKAFLREWYSNTVGASVLDDYKSGNVRTIKV